MDTIGGIRHWALLFNAACFVATTTTGALFRNIYGKDTEANGQITTRFYNLSKASCAKECRGTCAGFNYHKPPTGSGNCALLGLEASQAVIATVVDTTYYERLDHRFCADQSVCHIHGAGQTWAEALAKCPLLHPGSHLADIHSATENDALSHVVGNTAFNTCGKRRSDNEFYWEHSGERISGYLNWLPNNPSPASPDDNCIMLNPAAGWNDANCLLKRKYICEF